MFSFSLLFAYISALDCLSAVVFYKNTVFISVVDALTWLISFFSLSNMLFCEGFFFKDHFSRLHGNRWKCLSVFFQLIQHHGSRALRVLDIYAMAFTLCFEKLWRVIAFQFKVVTILWYVMRSFFDKVIGSQS